MMISMQMKGWFQSGFYHLVRFVLLSLIAVIINAGNASAETYQFDSMTPVLENLSYYPSDVAVDTFGNVYVADHGNSRIQKFNSSGDLVTAWGSLGSGNGQFDCLSNVAVDASGNVYVSDTCNNRIQKFNSSGDFITVWGSLGSGDGQFTYPNGVAVDTSGNVYVGDSGNNRVQQFNSSGDFIKILGPFVPRPEDSNIGSRYDVAVDGSGNVYVLDWSNSLIQKFNSSGDFVTTWGSLGSGDGQFKHPVGITVDPSTGNIYVADTNNHRIQKFNSSGDFLTAWGSLGSGNGQFDCPIGLAADPSSGNVYVADYLNHRIQKFVLAETLTIAGTTGNSTGAITGGSSIICSVAANGSTSGTCVETGTSGTAIVLIASPAEESYVTWTGCTTSLGNTCNVTLNADTTVTASFALNQYNLNVAIDPSSTGSGTVGGGRSYDYGTTHQVTATADPDSTFTGWSGDCFGTASPVDVLVDREKTCMATFTAARNISTDPVAHNFGDVIVGSASAVQTFIISNAGSLDLVVESITLTDTGPDIDVVSGGSNPCSSTLPFTLPANTSCTLIGTFSPGEMGSQNAILKIRSNDPDSSLVSIALSGTGILESYTKVTLLGPNGYEIVPAGSNYEIRWGAPLGATKFNLKYSMDNGMTWKSIASGIPGTSRLWQVPKPFDNKHKCLVKVIGYKANNVKVGADKSDAPFTVEVVKLTSPNGGGDSLISATQHTITWTTNAVAPEAYITLQYTLNNGLTWKTVNTTADLSNDGSFLWTVPAVTKQTTQCKVKIILKDSLRNVVGSDVSDNTFTIKPAP